MKYRTAVSEGEIWKFLDGQKLFQHTTVTTHSLYFHNKLTSFCENELNTENITELLDIIIETGLLARKADRRFCDEMKVGNRPEGPTFGSNDKIFERGFEQSGSIDSSSGNKQIPECYSQPSVGDAEEGPTNYVEGDSNLDAEKTGSDTVFHETVQILQEPDGALGREDRSLHDELDYEQQVRDRVGRPKWEVDDEEVYLVKECEATDQEDRHVYLTTTVYHGDCSLMRLTAQFYFEDEEKHYSFVKFAHYDDFKEAEDFKALVNGKSFLPIDFCSWRGLLVQENLFTFNTYFAILEGLVIFAPYI